MRRVPVTRVTYGSDLHYALEKGFTHPIEEKIGDVVAKRD
jgi:hypothetical protein